MNLSRPTIKLPPSSWPRRRTVKTILRALGLEGVTQWSAAAAAVKRMAVAARRSGDDEAEKDLSMAKAFLRRNLFRKCRCGATITADARACAMHAVRRAAAVAFLAAWPCLAQTNGPARPDTNAPSYRNAVSPATNDVPKWSFKDARTTHTNRSAIGDDMVDAELVWEHVRKAKEKKEKEGRK